jgi:uncharacterized protein YbjT (DUF2867 family)
MIVKKHENYRDSTKFIALGFLVLLLAIGHSKSSANDNELVLVAGATGRTGQATISELTRKGYRVRAFVRDIDSAKEKLGIQIEFAVGDVRDRESIDAAMHGVSAVISAIGAGRGAPENGPEFVDYGGVKNIVESAADAQVKHFVLVSSMGATQEDHPLNEMFNNILIWKFKGEEVLRKNGIAYTVVRPGGLTDEPGGESALLFQQGDSGEGRVSRADVARVLVDALRLPEARGKTFEVISGVGSAPTDLRGQFAALEED